MKNCKIEELQKISKQILASSIEEADIVIDKLLSFYNQFRIPLSSEEIALTHGIALSQKQAGDCIGDYKRTYWFLKGIYAAINECLLKFKGKQINILYAGCGPYATLLLSLIPLFKDEELKITLIDVNKDSIMSIKKIVEDLDLESFFSSITVSDAITYRFDKSKELHMVVTETMFNALRCEPQVAITNNLAPQLAPNGILIPEKITIDLGYSFFSKEPFLHQFQEEYNIKNRDTILDREIIAIELLKIDKKTNTEIDTENYFFESNWFSVNPNEISKNRPDICLYTKVNVYKDIELKNEDSLITNPYCIMSLYNLKAKKQYKVNYNLNKTPDWELLTN